MRKSPFSVRQLVLAAMFAALLAISSQIIVPMVPAPITLQTLVIMLAGLLLGPRLAAISITVFIALVVIGAPLLSGGAGGLGALLGPTGGFVLSWPLGSMLIGWLAQKVAERRELNVWNLMPINFLGGVLLIYAIGVPWLMVVTDLEFNFSNLIKTCFIFIPGDLLKVVIGSSLAIAVYKADPRMRPKGKK